MRKRVYMSVCACVRKRLIVANLMLYIGGSSYSEEQKMETRRWN